MPWSKGASALFPILAFGLDEDRIGARRVDLPADFGQPLADVAHLGLPLLGRTIGRGELLELEVRKLDRMRTGLIVGATAAIASSVLIKSLRGNAGKEPLPGGGGTDAIVFLRLGWP